MFGQIVRRHLLLRFGGMDIFATDIVEQFTEIDLLLFVAVDFPRDCDQSVQPLFEIDFMLLDALFVQIHRHTKEWIVGRGSSKYIRIYDRCKREDKFKC